MSMAGILQITNSRKKAEYLCQKDKSFSLVDLFDLSIDKDQKDGLDSDYVNFIGDLGEKYRSKFWWANSISEKNELVSKFSYRLLTLYNLHSYLNGQNFENVVVVCRDPILGLSIASSFKSRFSAVSHELKIWKIFHGSCNVIRCSVKTGLLIAEELTRKLLSWLYLKNKDFQIKNITRVHVLKVWIDHRSYRHGKYQDDYFKQLPEYLKKKDINYYLFADTIRNYRRSMQKIANDNDNVIIPMEYFVSIRRIFQAAAISVMQRPCIQEDVFFKDLDVTYLVNQELGEGFFSTKFLVNILYFFKTKAFAENIKAASFTYTFENYAWEKMSILALREAKQDIKIIGFQHAFISKNSFKYFLGIREADIAPKPDKVLTMGEVTKDILVRLGHWPGDILSIGCALRQAQTMKLASAQYGKQKDILVPFTMTADEAVRILNFLNEADLKSYPHNIILRFHPQTPVKRVLGSLKFKLPKNFLISENVSLADDLNRAGLVLYTWTTVGLEALMTGIPVIYLDVNRPLTLDPLFEWKDLKDEVGDPKELLSKIEKWLSLEQDQYRKSLSKSREYLRRYFRPITEDTLMQFVN